MKRFSILVLSASLLTACGEATPLVTTSSPVPTNTLPQYTLTEIAAHNQPTDCWMAIHDKVYNVTGLIASGNHAGGPVINQGCGKDATSMFEDRPGEGTPHSEQARSFLPNFYIGDLKK